MFRFSSEQMILYEVEGSGKIQPVSSLGEEAARHKKPDPSLTGEALHYKQCTRRGRGGIAGCF